MKVFQEFQSDEESDEEKEFLRNSSRLTASNLSQLASSRKSKKMFQSSPICSSFVTIPSPVIESHAPLPPQAKVYITHSTPLAKTHIVVIEDYEFSDNSIEANVGDIIRFDLSKTAPFHAEHVLEGVELSSDMKPDEYLNQALPSPIKSSSLVNKWFESPLLQKGETTSFEVRLGRAGYFRVSCKIFPDMVCFITCRSVDADGTSSEGIDASSRRDQSFVQWMSRTVYSVSECIAFGEKNSKDSNNKRAYSRENRNNSDFEENIVNDSVKITPVPLLKMIEEAQVGIGEGFVRFSPRRNGSISSNSFMDSDDCWSMSSIGEEQHHEIDSPKLTISGSFQLPASGRTRQCLLGIKPAPPKTLPKGSMKARPNQQSVARVKSKFTIAVEDFCFRPNDVTLPVGCIVEFCIKNSKSSSAQHRLHCVGEFENAIVSSLIRSFSHKFTKAGVFSVLDDVFSFLQCKITVSRECLVPAVNSRANAVFTVPHAQNRSEEPSKSDLKQKLLSTTTDHRELASIYMNGSKPAVQYCFPLFGSFPTVADHTDDELNEVAAVEDVPSASLSSSSKKKRKKKKKKKGLSTEDSNYDEESCSAVSSMVSVVTTTTITTTVVSTTTHSSSPPLVAMPYEHDPSPYFDCIIPDQLPVTPTRLESSQLKSKYLTAVADGDIYESLSSEEENDENESKNRQNSLHSVNRNLFESKETLVVPTSLDKIGSLPLFGSFPNRVIANNQIDAFVKSETFPTNLNEVRDAEAAPEITNSEKKRKKKKKSKKANPTNPSSEATIDNASIISHPHVPNIHYDCVIAEDSLDANRPKADTDSSKYFEALADAEFAEDSFDAEESSAPDDGLTKDGNLIPGEVDGVTASGKKSRVRSKNKRKLAKEGLISSHSSYRPDEGDTMEQLPLLTESRTIDSAEDLISDNAEKELSRHPVKTAEVEPHQSTQDERTISSNNSQIESKKKSESLIPSFSATESVAWGKKILNMEEWLVERMSKLDDLLLKEPAEDALPKGKRVSIIRLSENKSIVEFTTPTKASKKKAR